MHDSTRVCEPSIENLIHPPSLEVLGKTGTRDAFHFPTSGREHRTRPLENTLCASVCLLLSTCVHREARAGRVVETRSRCRVATSRVRSRARRSQSLRIPPQYVVRARLCTARRCPSRLGESSVKTGARADRIARATVH